MLWFTGSYWEKPWPSQSRASFGTASSSGGKCTCSRARRDAPCGRSRGRRTARPCGRSSVQTRRLRSNRGSE